MKPEIALFFAASALLAPCLLASDIPGLTLPAGVGVNIHFTRGHGKELDLIQQAGIKRMRQDFFWQKTERQKGVYDWSDYDDLTAQLERRGLGAYFILDYSNPLYEGTVSSINPITGAVDGRGTASPQHPESIAAFAAWAAAAAKHFHGHGIIWEIWNEPNIGFWKPKPEARQYIALALAACRALRQADPQATIVAPATSGFPWEFLEQFVQSDAIEYIDGLSVHPYRSAHHPPESAAADYLRLRALLEKWAPQGKKNIPILSGEWGYSSNTKGVPLEQQANFAARQQLCNLMCGAPVSIWYDWKNDGDDPAENEDNFGLVNSSLAPKPAYLAIQILTHALAGCRMQRRFDTSNTNDYVLVFTQNRSHVKLAAWTVSATHEVSLPLKRSSAKGYAFIDGSGRQGTAANQAGHLIIPVDGNPKYIDLQGGQLGP